MTENTNILYPADLVKIFGGDEKWHKQVLNNKYSIHVPKQYIYTNISGITGLYKQGLSEYKNILILLIGLTETHPWRDRYYSIVELGDQFGLSHGKKFDPILSALYDKIEAGEDCGLQKDDIIKTTSRQRRFSGHLYVYYLKRDALQKFAEIIQEPLKGQYKWLGYMDIRNLGYCPQVKIPSALEWAYKQIRNGNDIGLSPSDIRITKTGLHRNEVAYNIKSTAIEAFVAATGLHNPKKERLNREAKQKESKAKNKPDASTKIDNFEHASQTLHDAFGYEWTTTYTRMPRNKDER